MTDSAEEIVAALLIDLGFGTAPSSAGDWPISTGREPDRPDDAVTVYGTASLLQGRSMIGGQMFEKYGIQVRVRAANYRRGRQLAGRIATAMDETVYQNTVYVGTNRYLVHAISRKGGVLSLGDDLPKSNRSLFTVNAMVTIVSEQEQLFDHIPDDAVLGENGYPLLTEDGEYILVE